MARARWIFDEEDWRVERRVGTPGRGFVEGNISRWRALCLLKNSAIVRGSWAQA